MTLAVRSMAVPLDYGAGGTASAGKKATGKKRKEEGKKKEDGWMIFAGANPSNILFLFNPTVTPCPMYKSCTIHC